MSDPIKAAAERPPMTIEQAIHRLKNGTVMLDAVMWHEIYEMDETLWMALRTVIEFVDALGERQEDRWTHQRASDGALSMFTFATPQAAANYFHSEKDGRIVRVSTFIREEGEGA